MHAPKALLTVALAAVLGAGGGAAVVALAGPGGSTTVTTIEPRPAPVPAAVNGTLGAAQVYAHAKDSVASISADTGQGRATGSGFVISSQGLIVTNAHVVEGATAVTVKVGGGATLPATVVGRDASTDLALLRVERSGGTTFSPLALADSSALEVGDATYAIGSPFGLASTLTSGVVSALDRSIEAPNGFSIDHVIQTDAPINPGNSGGPLLDDRGRVIGVNSQILTATGSSQSGNVGIGFAIPSNTVRTIVRALETTGHVAHPWLGVQLAPTEAGAGARVAGIVAGGPAQRAGLQAGDTIAALDGRRVADASALAAAIGARRPGDDVGLTIDRGGARQTVTVTLGTQPQQQPVN
ncbi:MAG TPA: trypsin-like peptidase domain-containing protein [Conexibacter sp.]|nr:trypsin-like peptidase domain-containing protein [Conexibacter sp.]